MRSRSTMTRWLPFCCPRSDAERDSYATREASLPHFRSDRAGTITIVSSGALMRVESVPHGLELSLEAAIRANDVPAATELVVRALLEKRQHEGARPPELDVRGAYNGMTPLHDAVWHGRLEAARALVASGHLLNLRTHAGLTPRQLAVLYGYDDLAGLLAEAERARAS